MTYTTYKEVNFDGLVGPTHNYAGLSYGNVASKTNTGNYSNPKQAVLQGIQKMSYMNGLGLVQGVQAPQQRPNIQILRDWGFCGSDKEIIEKAYKKDPLLLSLVYSASSMWTANAATVSPSNDSHDQKCNIATANLFSNAHRAIEGNQTYKLLSKIFDNEQVFKVHRPLPGGDAFSDEGAANHTRLCSKYSDIGLHLFVYGREALNPSAPAPSKYPARQTLEASKAIARINQLDEGQCVFIQQNPEVINQGVFHNDVIAVGNKNVLFYHEKAFLNTKQAMEQINSKLEDFVPIEVKENDVSIEDAVTSYLFNTQLIEVNETEMKIIAPIECKENTRVKAEIEKVIASENPITSVEYFDLRQSMNNGGGPACLRLRVVLSEDEIKHVNQACLINSKKVEELNLWANKHYRDEIRPADLRDPALYEESLSALDELTSILNLGSLYDFQK